MGMEHRSSRGFWGDGMDLNGVSPDPDQGQDQQKCMCVCACVRTSLCEAEPRNNHPWSYHLDVLMYKYVTTDTHTNSCTDTCIYKYTGKDKAMALYQCHGQITNSDTIQPSPSPLLSLSFFVTYRHVCP